MYIHDFNRENDITILLIHPIFSNAEEMKKNLVDKMALDGVRIVIPDLSGHGQSRGDTYISSASEARLLYNYLSANGIYDIKFAMGVSLGSNVLFELLKYKDIKIQSVIFEGASARENLFVTSFLQSKYLFTIKSIGKISSKTAQNILSRHYNKKDAKILAQELEEMSKQSIENMLRDYYHVDLPYFRRMEQERLNFYYGSKDANIKFVEKRLKKIYPKANYFEWPYFKHCEKIYKEPRSYAEILRSYL